MIFKDIKKELKLKLPSKGFLQGMINGTRQESKDYIFISDKEKIIGNDDGFCHYELIQGDYRRVPQNETKFDGISCKKTNHRIGFAFLELHFEFKNSDTELFKVYRKYILPELDKLCGEEFELFRWGSFCDKPVFAIRPKKYYLIKDMKNTDGIVSDLENFDFKVGAKVRKILLQYRKEIYEEVAKTVISNIDIKTKIVQVRDLLSDNLSIPSYQRPYKWSTESAGILFNDLYNSFKKGNKEYRVGTVVLHYDSEFNTFNIVDGQQRLTTLSILIYCANKDRKDDDYTPCLLKKEKQYTEASRKAIVSNYRLLRKKYSNLEDSEKDNFLDYILDNCTFVKIITESEQEAFQFFDSQNSRGKALEPHDLLKSYHLREMNDECRSEKENIVNSWENVNQKDLALFFETCLYPLVKYYKKENGLYYSSKKIKIFKGLNQKNQFNFSIYHRAANLYIEHFNQEGMYELSSGDRINKFQLTQPIIAGKRFFQYVLYYYNLAAKIDELVNNYSNDVVIPENGSGNLYMKTLFRNRRCNEFCVNGKYHKSGTRSPNTIAN